MIPALIFWLLKQYRQTGSIEAVWALVKTIIVLKFFKAAILIVITMFILLGLRAQELKFSVIHRGDTIGSMRLKKELMNDMTTFKLNSSVKAKIIIAIKVITDEESHFRNGLLVYSLVNRKINNREPVIKRTRFENNAYHLSDGAKYKCLKGKEIRRNILCLYFNEPLSTDSVYCDNQQQWAPVKRISTNCYRVTMPDGNYNDFFYSKGVCTKVEISHSFYRITLLPNS